MLFDGLTALDLVGFYDAVKRVPRFSGIHVLAHLCAMGDEVRDDHGLVLTAIRVHPDLSDYDLVFVPGGFATRQLCHDEDLIAWLGSARKARYKVSVCTGALLLGGAGLLAGKRATTNPNAYDLLAPYCREVVKARIVPDGDVITAGGVAASIDLGLYFAELLTDSESARSTQRSMDYPYYRPGLVGQDYTI